jgi:hypothetical protein
MRSSPSTSTVADGTKLRVRGRLDSAPDGRTGDIAARIVLIDAVVQVLN